MRRVLAATLALALAPGAAMTHDAFGDMGPFYANLLHPLADPAQGLVLAGSAAFLARQPLDTVRPAYAALALGGAAAAVAAMLGATSGLSTRTAALLACLLGAGAMAWFAAPRWLAVALAGAAGLAAGLTLTAGAGLRDAALGLAGGALGVALAPLLVWGLVDLAVRKVGPVAAAVAGSWVAAVGIMTAALGA